jgi:hypothetical protein
MATTGDYTVPRIATAARRPSQTRVRDLLLVAFVEAPSPTAPPSAGRRRAPTRVSSWRTALSSVMDLREESLPAS